MTTLFTALFLLFLVIAPAAAVWIASGTFLALMVAVAMIKGYLEEQDDRKQQQGEL